jgi:radical SAM protein with 4Fe4S-binding SPASM domain
VVEYARKKEYGVALMTNGCRMTDPDARLARLFGVSDIQVSLEGPIDLHDAIRGKGTFHMAAKGVETLLGFGNRVSANVTLSGINVNRIEETVGIARDMGFSSIGFSRLVPCGRGKGLAESLISSNQLEKAYEKIKSLNRSGFEVLSGDPLFGTLSETKLSFGCNLTLSGCSAGFSGITITSDGTVMPCRRIGLAAGSLKKDSLRTIWASSKLLWKLRRRESYRGKCGSCSLWPSCRGCRAVAYAHSALSGQADLFADDPHCWIAE